MAAIVIFVVSLVATMLIVPLVIVKIPVDYFSREAERPQLFSKYPPPVRIALLILKNLLGAGLVIIGVAMLVLPGQGVIAVLIGVLLLDVPGKEGVERWLISKGPVLKLANWLREKWHKEPLVVD